MRKQDEISDPNGCLNKAMPGEMLFILLGRDKAAPDTIRAWVKLRIANGQNVDGDPLVQEALACADTMDKEYYMVRPLADLQKKGRTSNADKATDTTTEGHS